MNFKELEGKSQAELTGMLAEEQARLHGLNMKRSVNQVKDVRELREIKQRIAQIMTKITTLKV